MLPFFRPMVWGTVWLPAVAAPALTVKLGFHLVGVVVS